MLGKAVRRAGIVSVETIKRPLKRPFRSAKDLLSKNIEALEIGYNS